MPKIDIHKLAVDVTKDEGGKQSISIAQVKEVIRLTFRRLCFYENEDIIEAIRR